MKKILKSSFLVLAIAAAAGFATQSYFSDTETSTGNTFTAGEIDLEVLHNNSSSEGSCHITNGFESGGPIFQCDDVKPGDEGESTVKFDLQSNSAWGCVVVDNVVDSDNGCNDPEIAAESVCQESGDGELDQNMKMTVWIDTDCDNEMDSGEQVLNPGGTLLSDLMAQVNGSERFIIPVSDTSDRSMLGKKVAIQPGTQCLGIKWEVPTDTGNDVQTDKLSGDLQFYVEQERNNPNFTCLGKFAAITTQQTLTLENETQNPSGPWTPITGDNIQGTLSWNGDGSTFNYTLNAQGLPVNTPYSLIYYADPYPGNHPGKLIGTHTTESDGKITNQTGNPDLGMDLPDPADANFGTGAKIWLIPSANYNPTTRSVEPWAPNTTTWLFEGNHYIHYNDTDN